MLGAKIHFHLMSMTFAALSSAVITREKEKQIAKLLLLDSI